ncbi:MAG: segregation and condensation protein A [Chitinophagales bacterium]
MTYKIKLPQFEGPFDLLLFFIERDEIDIHDIPIAQLTNEFLEYMHKLEMLNIDLASEFILVAASLMRIKAKMLLPRKELNEAGEEIDPREELVEKLLEYKKFKKVVKQLANLEEKRLEKIERGYALEESKYIGKKYNTELELESLNLFKLLQVFHKVMNRFENKKQKTHFSVVRHPYTIKQQKSFFQAFMFERKQATFEAIFSDCDNKVMAIFRFLALLELTQEQKFVIHLGLGFNNFWLTKYETEIAKTIE